MQALTHVLRLCKAPPQLEGARIPFLDGSSPVPLPALGLGGIRCASCPHEALESFSDSSAAAHASSGCGDTEEDWCGLPSEGLPSLWVTSTLFLTQAFEVGRNIWVVLGRDGPHRRPEKLCGQMWCPWDGAEGWQNCVAWLPWWPFPSSCHGVSGQCRAGVGFGKTIQCNLLRAETLLWFCEHKCRFCI